MDSPCSNSTFEEIWRVFLRFLAVLGACIRSQSLFIVGPPTTGVLYQDDIVSLLSKRVYDVAGSTLVARLVWWGVEIIQSCCEIRGSSETTNGDYMVKYKVHIWWMYGEYMVTKPSTGSLYFGFLCAPLELCFVPESMLGISKLTFPFTVYFHETIRIL